LELVRLRRPQRLSAGPGGRAMSGGMRPALSVVIPVFNEAPTLDALHRRLTQTLERVARPYEIIFVDDGSRDESADVLRALRARDAAVRVIRFNRNYGQHAARGHGRARYGPVRLLRLVFALSVQVLALGPLGARARWFYQEVRRGPRYVIAEVLE